MAWSADLLAKLADPTLLPVVTFECVPDFDRFITGNPVTGIYQFSGDWKFSTRPISGYIPAIMREEASTANGIGRVQQGTWGTPRGSFSIPLALAPEERAALWGQITRGQGCAIKVGFEADGSDLEVFLLGVVRDVVLRSATKVVVECNDIVEYLTCRSREMDEVKEDAEFSGQSALFHQLTTLPTAVRTPAGYTVGDADLPLDSLVGSQRGSDGYYAALVTPDAGAPGSPERAPFLLSADDRDPTVGSEKLLGVSATGQWGTTAYDAAQGNAVQIVARETGHPIDIARRILCSTGTRTFGGGPGLVVPTPGENGPWDVLHASWGYGVDDSWIDHDDCDYFKVRSQPGIGPDGYVMVVTAAQPDGLAFLMGWLGAGGWWLAQRQGQLTIRAAIDPEAFDNAPSIEITDADVEEVLSFHAWDPSQPVEYDALRVTAGTGDQATHDDALGLASTLPAGGTLDITVDGIRLDAADWLDEVAERLGPWVCRVCETVEIVCAGLRLAQLTPGDLVSLTTSRIGGRDCIDPPTYSERTALVLGVQADIFRATVVVILAIRPLTSAP